MGEGFELNTERAKLSSGVGPDKVVRAAMMATRAGFLLAVVLGFGMMMDLITRSVLPLHILSGVLTLGGILVAGGRALSLGRSGLALLGVGIGAGLVGAVVALTNMATGIVHLALMVAAVALAEMTMARLKRG